MLDRGRIHERNRSSFSANTWKSPHLFRVRLGGEFSAHVISIWKRKMTRDDAIIFLGGPNNKTSFLVWVSHLAGIDQQFFISNCWKSTMKTWAWNTTKLYQSYQLAYQTSQRSNISLAVALFSKSKCFWFLSLRWSWVCWPRGTGFPPMISLLCRQIQNFEWTYSSDLSFSNIWLSHWELIQFWEWLLL